MVDIIFNGNNNKKKRVKRLSASSTIHYYPSAYITKPCDQLFGINLALILKMNKLYL